MAFQGKRASGEYLSGGNAFFAVISVGTTITATQVIILTKLVIANQTSSNTTVDIYITPAGTSGNPTNTHLVAPNVDVYADDFESVELNGIMLLRNERLILSRPSQNISYSIAYLQEE